MGDRDTVINFDKSVIDTVELKTDLRLFFIKVFLVFLPYSQALTLNIIFPLKVSEIALFILAFLSILQKRDLHLHRIFLLLFAFCLVVLISVVINSFYIYDYSIALEYVRFTPGIDSLLKFFYIILSIWSMYIVYTTLKKKNYIIRYFFIGAISASIYSWYLFSSGLLGIPALLLPGMDDTPQTIGFSFGQFIRCGTFKEGNYMGFFLLLSGVVAIHYNKIKYAAFFFITIITTFSSAALVCSVLFFILYILRKYKRYKTKAFFVLTFLLLFVSASVVFITPVRVLLYNKLIAPPESVENANDVYSRLDRINTTLIGLKLFQNNPVWGVGLAQYSLHYDHYNLQRYDTLEFKRIPNNIYIEILSETGIFGFILFICFLYSLYSRSKVVLNPALNAGLQICAAYFLAFPTFTMLFIWFYFGTVLVNASIESEHGFRAAAG